MSFIVQPSAKTIHHHHQSRKNISICENAEVPNSVLRGFELQNSFFNSMQQKLVEYVQQLK